MSELRKERLRKTLNDQNVIAALAIDQRGARQHQRGTARGRLAGAAQLGLPLLREPSSVRRRQAGRHPESLEGPGR